MRERKRKGLIIAGAVVGGIGYMFMLVAAPIVEEVWKDEGRSTWAPKTMYIPVLGPFLSIWSLDASGGGSSALIMDGLMQTSGAIMLYAGLTSKKKEWIRQDLAGTKFIVTPTRVGKHGWGVGAVGTF